MIRTLSDSEYAELAEAALKNANVAPPMHSRSRAQDCKHVHRLLAVDGQKVESLMPYEQALAKAFAGVKLASVPELDIYNLPTGNRLPAVEVSDEAPKPLAIAKRGKR